MTEPGRRRGPAAQPGTAPPATERRTSGEDRRRSARRAPATDLTPPYAETFERIALALERIERFLEQEPSGAPRQQQPRDSAADARPGDGPG